MIPEKNYERFQSQSPHNFCTFYGFSVASIMEQNTGTKDSPYLYDDERIQAHITSVGSTSGDTHERKSEDSVSTKGFGIVYQNTECEHPNDDPTTDIHSNKVLQTDRTSARQLAKRFVRYGKWGCPINVYYSTIISLTIFDAVTDIIVLTEQFGKSDIYFWSSLLILGLCLCVCAYFGQQYARHRDSRLVFQACAALVIFESFPQCLLQIWSLWTVASTPTIWLSLCVSVVSIWFKSTLFVPVAIYFADSRSAMFLWTAANVDLTGIVLVFTWSLELSVANESASKYLYFYLFLIVAGTTSLFSVNHFYFILKNRIVENSCGSKFLWGICVVFVWLFFILEQVVFCSFSAFIIARAGHIRFVTEQNWLGLKLYFNSIRQLSMNGRQSEQSVMNMPDANSSIDDSVAKALNREVHDAMNQTEISFSLPTFAKRMHMRVKSVDDVCRMWFALQMNQFYRLETMSSLIRISFPLGFYIYILLSFGWTNIHSFIHILNLLYTVSAVTFMITASHAMQLANAVISENRRTWTFPDQRVRNEGVIKNELDRIVREMFLLMVPANVVDVVTAYTGTSVHLNLTENGGLKRGDLESLAKILKSQHAVLIFAEHLKKEWLLTCLMALIEFERYQVWISSILNIDLNESFLAISTDINHYIKLSHWLDIRDIYIGIELDFEDHGRATDMLLDEVKIMAHKLCARWSYWLRRQTSSSCQIVSAKLSVAKK